MTHSLLFAECRTEVPHAASLNPVADPLSIGTVIRRVCSLLKVVLHFISWSSSTY